jgi:uncharacterized membrane protein
MLLRRNDSKSVEVAKSLKWYQWLFIGSPTLIFILSRANRIAFEIAVPFVLIGIFVNLKIFRSESNNRQKYVFSSVLTILLLIFYIAIIIVLILLLYGRA